MLTSRNRLPRYARELWRPHRHKCLYGGRGGSKTWTVARALLTMAAERPLRILCAREIQNSIKDSVHRTLSDQAASLNLPYEIREQEIRHPNGSLFLFRGLHTNEQIQGIKSLEGIDICWVEEANRLSQKSWEVLLPTIRKPGSEIWATFNTDLEDDPAFVMFVKQPLPDTWTKKVGWQDNPWFHELPELVQLKAHAYAVDPDAADNVWGGNPRKETDAQILRGKWFVEEFEPQAHWDGPYHGLDFGFALNPTVASKLWIATGPKVATGVTADTLYVEREAWKIGLELDDTADFITERIPGIEGYTLRADSARPESISYLRRGGPRQHNPLKKIEACAKWPGSIEDGIAHLRQYVRIVIHPRCERAIFEAKNYSYVVDERTGDIKPKARDLHNDFWDSARYGLGPLIRRRHLVRRSLPSSGAVRQR